MVYLPIKEELSRIFKVIKIGENGFLKYRIQDYLVQGVPPTRNQNYNKEVLQVGDKSILRGGG